jgi:hypothetical protein
MKKDNESWNEQNQRLQNAQDAKNADRYGYRKGFIPIISFSLIKKIICWFKKKK